MALYPALDIRDTDSELTLAIVDEFSPTAAEERDGLLTVFFSSATDRDRAREAVCNQFPHAHTTARDVDDEDWARRSQQNLRPVTVGQITVAPPWAVPPESPIPDPRSLFVIIQPSMGFGTGHHATTRLCLAAMQAIPIRDQVVLDVGTGSGVLALAARRLGADTAIGIDVDPDAIQSAAENLVHNGLSSVEFVVGDLASLLAVPGGRGADVVTANLTGALIVRSAALLLGAARPGGHLILSGILESEKADVMAAFANRTRIVSVSSEEEWVGLILEKANS